MFNLVVWAKVFEAHRRIALGAGMIGVQGCIQREGEVVHFVVHRIEDLSKALASVGQRKVAFPLRQGRGDEGGMERHALVCRKPHLLGLRRERSISAICISIRSG